MSGNPSLGHSFQKWSDSLRAANLNTHFSNEELQALTDMIRPFQLAGILGKPEFRSNSFSQEEKQSFMTVPYKENPIKMALFIQKTLKDSGAPDYEAQINIHEERFLQTTRFKTINLSLLLNDLSAFGKSHWPRISGPSLIYSG